MSPLSFAARFLRPSSRLSRRSVRRRSAASRRWPSRRSELLEERALLATTVFINEFHYDNAGGDVLEGIEVAGPAGTDLSGWQLVLYNGNNEFAAVTYNTRVLSGIIPNQQNGFGAIHFAYTDAAGMGTAIQNGPRDGFALVDPGNNVVQLLSYAGTFTASNGPAAGMMSVDIGVAQAPAPPVGTSLQLQGSGSMYEDFTWTSVSITSTFGAVNTGQFFTGTPTGTVAVVESGGSTDVSEDGLTDTYTLALSDAPAGAVTIEATADGQLEVSLDGVNFTASVQVVLADTNPVTITVRAIDDTVLELTHTGVITHAIIATNDASLYPSTLPIASVTATIADNEVIPPAPTIKITEIMYNVAGADTTPISSGGAQGWEWIEIYNFGPLPVDLTGFVVDDDDGLAHPAPNIAGGVVQPGEAAVLFDVDRVSLQDFIDVWGPGNWIPVTGWDSMQLGNGGNEVALWHEYALYAGNHQTHANAFDIVFYQAGTNGWPPSVDGVSVYLLNHTLDNNLGENWALSQVGVDGAYEGNFTAVHPGLEIASPGFVPQPPAPAVLVIESGGSTTVDEDQLMDDTYELALNVPPASGQVTVRITADAQQQVSIDGLSFVHVLDVVLSGPPQLIYVRAVDDAILEGPHTGTITHAIIATDDPVNYPLSLLIPSIAVNIIDNEGGVLPGATITETTGSTDVTEGGNTDTYEIALNTVPAAVVTITITADSQVLVSTDGVNFGPTAVVVLSDTTPATITVQAVDDTLYETFHTGVITHAVTASTDPDYPLSLAIASVTVNISDNDPIPPPPTILISEILYDSQSSEASWEWIEIYNYGAAPVDLTGFIVDDINSTAHPGPNILGGVVQPGEAAVLYNGDLLTAAMFEAAWGTGINLIPVTGWSTMALGNDGDTVGLWHAYALYDTDHNVHANAFVSIQYGIAAPWPATVPGYSIYLTNPALPATNGANWALSQVGVDGAYQSLVGGSSFGSDFGSPGFVPAPTPGVLLTETGGSTDVEEGGATDTYTLELTTLPSGPVTITITADAQTLVSSDGVNFASSVVVVLGDATPATITVQAVDDALPEGLHNGTISHAITASSDPNYPVSLAIPPVLVFLTDNDGPAPTPTLLISEVMYNPNSADANWEWIELFNFGAAPIDLTGFVVDDNNNTAHSAANIPGGVVAPGGTAVLFNGDTLSAADFAAAWGGGINLIGISGFAGMGLNNGVGGDRIGVWHSYAAYRGDHVTANNAFLTLDYDTVAPWPATNNIASIYLVDLNADPNDGANWALSVEGVDGAYRNNAGGGANGNDIGSPGLLPGVGPAPTVVVIESGGVTMVEEGGATDTYTLGLTTIPSGPVEIMITADSQLLVSADGVNFAAVVVVTLADTTPATITVQAVDDAVVEGPHVGVIAHAITASADGDYPLGLAIPDVTAVITDNDVAAPLAPIYISEIFYNPPGTDAPHEYVELRGTPGAVIPAGVFLVGIEGDIGANAGDVQTIFDLGGLQFGSNGLLVLLQFGHQYTVDPASTAVVSTSAGFSGLGGRFSADSGGDIENASVTFLVINSAVAPTLTDDIDADNDGVPDGVYANWTVLDSVGILDNSTNGDLAYGAINFAHNVGDGASLTGPVVLIPFTAAYVGRYGDRTGSTASDWVLGDALAGAAGNFALAAATYPANMVGAPLDHVGAANRPHAGIVVAPTSGLVTTEAGATATFAIVLTTEPTADVTIPLSSSNTAEGTVAPASVTFTPANWDQPQTVTITGVDDLVVDGDVSYTIVTAPAVSSDSAYDGLDADDVAVANLDNDTAGVVITESGGSTQVTEGGATDTYTIALTSIPSAPVTVTITADSQLLVSADGVNFLANVSIVLTNTNPATIVVRAVDDALFEGPHAGSITHAITTSADSNYPLGLPIAGVTAAITDNDPPPAPPGVTIVQSGGSTQVAEGGATDTYTIALNSAPLGAVTISITADSQLLVSTDGVTFLAAVSVMLTDTSPVTITVQAVDDAIVEGTHQGVITHAISATGDPASYPATMALPPVIATILDNDTPPPQPPGTVTLVGGDLYVTGNDDANRIVIYPGSGGTVLVRLDNQVFGAFVVTGRVYVDARGGDDQVSVSGSLNLPMVFDGGPGNDYLAGGLGDDTLIGGPGNDVILGGEGNNFMSGGEGNDRIEGRSGDDTILGGPGNDRLSGRGGNDLIDGGAGNDQIAGGDGDDLLIGGPGDDVVSGDWGDDLIVGGEGDDVLYGRQGSDVLLGGAGLDRLRGDAGDDLLIGNLTSLDDIAVDAGNAAAVRALLAAVLADWVGARAVSAGLLAGDDGVADRLLSGSGSDAFQQGTLDRLEDFRPQDGDWIL